MRTNNPVVEFERELRRSIRWRSPFGRNEEAIQELVGHYSDLYEEEINRGASVEEASKSASLKIGSVREVARQAISSDPKGTGTKLQYLAIILLIFFVFSPRLIEMPGYTVGSVWGNFVEFWVNFSDVAFAMTGLLMAFGILKAKRISLAASLLGIFLIPALWAGYNLYLYKSVSRYDASMAKHQQSIEKMLELVKPAFFQRQALMKECLETPSIQKLKEFSVAMQTMPIVEFHVEKREVGQWYYPISFQNLRPEAKPFVIFGRTSSLEEARAAWAGSKNLRAIMPKMEARAIAHFKNFEQIDFSRWKFSRVIFDNSYYTISRFIVCCISSLLAIGLLSHASKRIRPRRRAL